MAYADRDEGIVKEPNAMDRPVRRKYGTGIYCTVCLARGEKPKNYGARFTSRENLIEHWEEEHY